MTLFDRGAADAHFHTLLVQLHVCAGSLVLASFMPLAVRHAHRAPYVSHCSLTSFAKERMEKHYGRA